MPREVFKPGMAFKLAFVKEDVFLFAFSSSLIEGDALYRRFNRVGGFIDPAWYRFSATAPCLTRAEEFDFL